MSGLAKMAYPNLFILIAAIALLPSAIFAAPQETLFSDPAENYTSVRVERVVSADTFVLDTGERIKLIGLRAPEVPKNTERIEYDSFGFVVEKEATPFITVEESAVKFIKEMLEGKTVRLEFDTQKKDSGRATLAYVFLEDNTFVNAEVLRAGYANLQIQAPNLKYAETLAAAYREARKEKRGLQSE